MILVRLEEERDYRIVEEVTKAAFSYPERIERSKIGCCLEHYMVHSLREKDGIKELSFVAEIDGKIQRPFMKMIFFHSKVTLGISSIC